MAREFQRGHKAKISDLTAGTDLYVGVQIAGPGLTFDISCFGLDAEERLSDDRYFIFFNQPTSPEESIRLLGEQAGDSESFRVTLDRVPAGIHKLSFTATIDGAGQMSQVGPGYIRVVAGGEEVVRYSFTGAEFSTERAVMLGDFYLKDVWRFAAVGQGFDGGLEALLKNFGGEVMEEEAPAPQQQAQQQVPQQAAAAPSFAPPAFAAPPAAPPRRSRSTNSRRSRSTSSRRRRSTPSRSTRRPRPPRRTPHRRSPPPPCTPPRPWSGPSRRPRPARTASPCTRRSRRRTRRTGTTSRVRPPAGTRPRPPRPVPTASRRSPRTGTRSRARSRAGTRRPARPEPRTASSPACPRRRPPPPV